MTSRGPGRRMRAPLLLLAASVVFAGCAAPEAADLDPTAVDTPGPEPGSAIPRAMEPVVLVERGGDSPGSFELDACMGGPIDLPRAKGALILPGVTKLVATIGFTTGTGLRLGYATDGADIVWTPTVAPPGGSVDIPVPPELTEEAGERWTFHYEANLPGPAEQDCYTGAIVNGWSLRIETALE